MNVFISHINEESALALTLKEWIESSFSGKCQVFVSSDKDDIPAGTKWFERIEKALGDAGVLIVLCSAESLSRPWINFETGCGWMKNIPILPICHSAQRKATLPPPISRFQALDLDDPKFVFDLLSALAKHLNFPKVPRIDQEAMRSELDVAMKAQTKAPAPMPMKADEVRTGVELPNEAVELLKIMAADSRHLNALHFSAHTRETQQRVQYFLDMLHERKLVQNFWGMGQPATYALSPNGRKYLFERKLL